jgi:hypothetical protein
MNYSIKLPSKYLLLIIIAAMVIAVQPLRPASAQEAYVINLTLGGEVAPIEGFDRHLLRQVGVVEAPDGSRDAFVLDEIIIRPSSDKELKDFLSRYHGRVVQTWKPRLIEGESPRNDLPLEEDWLLVAVDPETSPLDDMAQNIHAADLDGPLTFSSEAAARLIALALRERDKQLSPNFLARFQQTTTIAEHPTAGGGNLNAASWWYMNEDDDPTVSGIQGLSIGVIRAWDYLRYQGYPREGQPYVPVKVAVIDSGFDLDQTTGLPLNGNLDYFQMPPAQIDEVDGDNRVGGASTLDPTRPWHGQKVFGVCCSVARNSWGTAGIVDGKEIRLLLIRTGPDHWSVRNSIMDALYNNADVINLSLGESCGSVCATWYGGGWSTNVLGSAVGSARNVGAVVISAAGNDGKDIGGAHFVPCDLDGSICVSAIGKDGMARPKAN